MDRGKGLQAPDQPPADQLAASGSRDTVQRAKAYEVLGPEHVAGLERTRRIHAPACPHAFAHLGFDRFLGARAERRFECADVAHQVGEFVDGEGVGVIRARLGTVEGDVLLDEAATERDRYLALMRASPDPMMREGYWALAQKAAGFTTGKGAAS